MTIIYTKAKPSYDDPPPFFRVTLIAKAVFLALNYKLQGGAE